MKRILMSILALAVLGIVTGGTVLAYFSDTETSENTFIAGVVNITLTGDVDMPVHNGLLDFKPGETGYLVFTITNGGTGDEAVWKLIHSVVCENGISVSPEDSAKNDIDTVTHFGMWIEGGDVWPDPPSDTDYHHFNGDDVMLVDEALGLCVSDVEDFYMYIGTIPMGESITIVETFHMDASTTNWAQGDIMTFSEMYPGQQPEAPSPEPELDECAR
jgi:spore coat-associated protein N